MPKIYARNHLLHDIQEVGFRPFPDFAGGERSGRVGHEQAAETVDDFPFLDQRMEPVGEVDNLFDPIRLDLQCLHDAIIDNPRRRAEYRDHRRPPRRGRTRPREYPWLD